jgi:predicted nucleic acid-binding protein
VKGVFADSFYFFALLNPRDAAHGRALEFSRAFDGLIVSSSWVFTELGDGLSAPPDRAAFVRLLDHFTVDPLCRLIGPSPEFFQAGVDLFRARSDKGWSLTDCISFAIMRRENLIDALTGDHHFN